MKVLFTSRHVSSLRTRLITISNTFVKNRLLLFMGKCMFRSN